ncbi:site-2 protease family protein [Bosea sp. RAC05]|uniref:site-2 protease family protein n=1 Tax=Bosea sp. RAC05 TaxID=1842539 RepID=UPI00083D7D77|nr:site-2 protease family protein [Bosea sp. RAC05]AOG03146.1 peptidase M50 family protein [Bosea sp. RAC05]
MQATAATWLVRPSLNFSMLVLLCAGAFAALHAEYAVGSPLVFVAIVSGWLVSLCLHEFAHAYAAYLAGDHSERTLSYLTFDPARYVDPLTSIVLPAIVLAIGGIALPGGAVWLETSRIPGRLWDSLISLAGPAANALCLLALAILWTMLVDENSPAEFDAALAALAFFQAMALVLNLMPVPGLDGWGAISPWLPPHIRDAGNRMTGLTLLFVGVLIFVPGFGAAIARLSAVLIAGLGFDVTYAAYGLGRLTFWE